MGEGQKAGQGCGRSTDEQLHAIAVTAAALGIASVAPLIFAQTTARAHAALNGRKKAGDADIAAAVRLVLAPRATQMPQSAPPPEQEDDQPQDNEPDENDDDRNIEDIDLEDIMLEAAAAAIPKHILDQIDVERKTRRQGAGRQIGAETEIGDARSPARVAPRRSGQWQAPVADRQLARRRAVAEYPAATGARG